MNVHPLIDSARQVLEECKAVGSPSLGALASMDAALRLVDPDDDHDYTPIETAIALSLYGYNVSPGLRAERLYEHFAGACAEPEELLDCMQGKRLSFAATEMAFPTAEVYVRHALLKYGQEARARVRANRGLDFVGRCAHGVRMDYDCDACEQSSVVTEPISKDEIRSRLREMGHPEDLLFPADEDGA